MFYRQNTEHGIKSIPEKQQEKESSLFRTFSNLPKVTGTQILVKKKIRIFCSTAIQLRLF